MILFKKNPFDIIVEPNTRLWFIEILTGYPGFKNEHHLRTKEREFQVCPNVKFGCWSPRRLSPPQATVAGRAYKRRGATAVRTGPFATRC
jgi:hypothetical protein